jgi:hypothetical protein
VAGNNWNLLGTYASCLMPSAHAMLACNDHAVVMMYAMDADVLFTRLGRGLGRVVKRVDDAMKSEMMNRVEVEVSDVEIISYTTRTVCRRQEGAQNEAPKNPASKAIRISRYRDDRRRKDAQYCDVYLTEISFGSFGPQDAGG